MDKTRDRSGLVQVGPEPAEEPRPRQMVSWTFQVTHVAKRSPAGIPNDLDTENCRAVEKACKDASILATRNRVSVASQLRPETLRKELEKVSSSQQREILIKILPFQDILTNKRKRGRNVKS